MSKSVGIRGIGIDIESVGRFRHRPYSKIFTPAEIKYCRSKADPAQHFAVRFAAKEAVIKALGKSIYQAKDIEILNDKNGKPQVRFQISDFRFQILISLSHTKDYAIAVALWLN